MITAGATAPDFEIPAADGKLVQLSSLLRDSPVLLAFFKVTCPVCQYTLPFLERLSGHATVLGVSQDSPADTAEFCRSFGITFPMAFDPGRGYPASSLYRITHVPSVFLIEPNGRIALAGSGFSRADLGAVASRFGVPVFRDGERVPDFRPG
jgi:peroxiredoxin